MKFLVNFLSRQNLFLISRISLFIISFSTSLNVPFSQKKKNIENVIKTGKSNLFGEHFRCEINNLE